MELLAAPEREGAVVEARSYVNGEWVTGGGSLIEVTSPASGELVSRVQANTPEEIDVAVAAAREAQREWGAQPVGARIQPCMRAVEIFEQRRDDFRNAICGEVGKTETEFQDDLYGLMEVFHHTAEDALRHSGKIVPGLLDVESVYAHGGKLVPETTYPASRRRVLVTHAPVGVVAVMTPWNFPAAIPAELCAPALLAGNAVVWKPSEWTPGTAQILAECMAEAGFPDGVFNVVHGAGQAGAQLVEHRGTDMVAFVGSTPTGERIARAAGVKKLLLELGGNGPFVVMEDANLDVAAEMALAGAFYLAGQVCTAAERFLVHDSVHDAFVEKVVALAGQLQLGDPFNPETTMGPLTIHSSLEKTRAHLDEATSMGAEIVAGGSFEGLFHEPTVITGVTPEMRIAREETFGPVAPMVRFSSDEEMVRIANDSDFGLTGAVFTQSLDRGWDLADQINCGTVQVNWTTNHWEPLAPFGGVKKSGFGRVLGEGAMHAFTDPKQITYERL
jgi:acyl-CoA reductase-like NAD-dependent aldehyde dehydrogenase